MLGELPKVAQKAGEPGFRRWFADEEMDLIVFYAGGEIVSFQLCYDKTGSERAVLWRRDRPLLHYTVDQGEELPSDNRSPILVEYRTPPSARVAADFAGRSLDVEPAVRALVLRALNGPAAGTPEAEP